MWWDTSSPNPEFKRMPFVINIEVSFCKKAGRGTNFTKVLHRLICAQGHPQKKSKKKKHKTASCMWGLKSNGVGLLWNHFLDLLSNQVALVNKQNKYKLDRQLEPPFALLSCLSLNCAELLSCVMLFTKSNDHTQQQKK
jgi:hypothetical protein